jgi:hypothetical protein
MAALLQQDGLATTHRSIELLICYGGSSVGTRASVARYRQLQAAYVAAFRRNDQREMDAIEAQYERLPSITPEPYTRPGQQIPLAGETFLALHRRGYTALTVTAYQAQVTMNFPKGQVELDLPPVTLAARVPKYAVSWRS